MKGVYYRLKNNIISQAVEEIFLYVGILTALPRRAGAAALGCYIVRSEDDHPTAVLHYQLSGKL